MQCKMVEKAKIAELLRLEEVAISAYSIFLERGNLQHGVCGWQGSQTLCYHTHLISLCSGRKIAVEFVSKASIAAFKRPAKCQGK